MSIAIDTRTILNTLRPRREAVRRRLASLRRGVRWRMLLVGVAWIWTALFLFAAISLTADWLLRLSLPVRVSALAAAAVAVAMVARRRLVSPLLLRLDDLDLAALVDRHCPGAAQRVASVLQLPALIEGRASASPAMVEAAVLEHAQALDRTDFRSAFDHRGQGQLLKVLLTTGLIAGVFASCRPDVARLWTRRWFLGSNERWPQANYLSLLGLHGESRLLVPRGESLLVEVDAAPQFQRDKRGWFYLGGRGEPLRISSRLPRPQPVAPETVVLRYRPAAGPAKQANFTRIGDTRFRYEIPQVSEPLTMSITGGDDWFGPIAIVPIDRPAVSSLVVRALRPGAARPHPSPLTEGEGAAAAPPHLSPLPVGEGDYETHNTEGGDSQLLFLPDTDLTLELTASVPLSAARLQVKGGSAPGLERRDDTHFTAHWKMRESQTFELSLVSQEGGLSSKPYFVSIGLLIDRPPRVSIRSSGVGRRVTPQARIPLALHAADDFGMTSLALELEQTLLKDEKPATKTDRVALELPSFTPDAAPTDLDEQPSLSLAERALAPGTLVKLRGQAIDNRAFHSSPLAPREESQPNHSSPLAPREESPPLREAIGGPQTGSSRWLTFQVVTPEELFYEILMRQRAERAKFAAALETAKTQTGPLAGVVSAEVAFGLVRKHQVVARQVWQVANHLEVSLTEMALNDLGSQQARDLLRTNVIDAIGQLHAEPMSRLRAALEAVAADPDGAVEPLAEARELQQEVVDKMAKILEQMSQWENFVDVLNQLKAIVKQQSGVLEATEAEKKRRTRDLFDD
ncbi:MAG TPA: hypothetical protein VF278_10190 [Pirellulales bacterium]